MQKLKRTGLMYLAPPQIASSFQSGTSMPGTTGSSGLTPIGSSGTVGLTPIGAIITPERQPSILAGVISGAVTMLEFAWGWNRIGKLQARAKMPSASPTDKKVLSRAKWQGVAATAILAPLFFLPPEEYRGWAFVAGLPLTGYFLPGLFRGVVLGWWGPTKKRVQTQQRKRHKQQQKRRGKKSGQRQRRYPARPSGEFDFGEFEEPSRRQPRTPSYID